MPNKVLYKMNNFLKFYFILALTTILTLQTVKAEKYLENQPDILTPCHLEDSNFNKCFAKNFQVLFHEWKDGVPGLKSVGSLDPLFVKRLLITQDPKDPVALNADLSNVVIKGTSDVVIKDASFNPKTLASKVVLFLPKLRFESDYKLNGRILNLELNGNGKTFFEVEKCDIIFNIHLKLRDEHGFTFTDTDKMSVEIGEVGGFHIRLDNLFNGQKVLEESTNAVFNENWREFYKILHPAIKEAVELIMKDRLSKIYNYVPANYFIADIPSAAKHSG